MGSVLCEHCTAACCRYIAVEIDRPRSAKDYDDIRWYVMHEGISVFVEDGDWYIQIQARCKNLGQDNLCRVYETRPQICREYEPGRCDYSTKPSGYDLLFTHAQEVEEHYRKKTGRSLPLPRRDKKRAKIRQGKRKSA